MTRILQQALIGFVFLIPALALSSEISQVSDLYADAGNPSSDAFKFLDSCRTYQSVIDGRKENEFAGRTPSSDEAVEIASSSVYCSAFIAGVFGAVSAQGTYKLGTKIKICVPNGATSPKEIIDRVVARGLDGVISNNDAQPRILVIRAIAELYPCGGTAE